jgi:diacylglycerol kinase family enzyme
VRQAVRDGATRVVAAGGDGTISAVAAAIAESDVELAVVPAGTFNHFAKDNGIPLDLDEACELAARGSSVAPVDVAWVNGWLFLNTSSVGVYANFVKGREKWERRFGYWLSSTISMIRNFIRVQPFTLWFSAGATDRPYQTPLVFIGVGERELKLPTLGNRVENGRQGLHVMIVRGRTRARLVALAFAAAARGVRAVSRTPHLDSMMLQRFRIEQRHATIAVDGEIVRMPSPLEYRFGKGALRLVVGPGTGG